MEKIELFKKRFLNFRYKGIIGVTLVFFLIAVILFTERSGINYNYTAMQLDLLPKDKVITQEEAIKNIPKETLFIFDSSQKNSVAAYSQLAQIFKDMKISCKEIDVAKDFSFEFDDYKTVVVAIPNLEALGDYVFKLVDYVKGGGQAFLPVTFEKNAYFTAIENSIGVSDSAYSYSVLDNIHVAEDFMVGGGRTFSVDDSFDSALTVSLAPDRTKVYAHIDGESTIPLIWEARYGKGKYAVVNIGLYEKVLRGFYAAAYSLLTDVCVYPVINGSVFYLDDFPSQIPSGNNEYIYRDYHTSTRDFYVNIWWPDMMTFADKYNLRYTGLAIQSYDDSVDGSTDAVADKGTFLNFGNMLLRQGGEIGYHGYNHQPLCLGNCDYKGEFDYKTWESTKAMKSAFDELVNLCDEIFPDVTMAIYVPPSNILSKEGESFLIKEYPQIKTISGIYFPDSNSQYSWVQEYGVSDSGVVNQPRVVSGCDIDNFMSLAVISELNFHFANNHFTHPDDALDPDRGAELGWNELTKRFDNYLSWLYSAAPSIRNFTGTEMSAAVQRYTAVTVSSEIKKNKMTITLGNFQDEAQLMLRFNEKKPGRVSGGKLEKLTGNLYLLEANSPDISINLK